MRLISFVFKTVEKLAHLKCTDDEAVRLRDYQTLMKELGEDNAFTLATIDNASGRARNGERSRLAVRG